MLVMDLPCTRKEALREYQSSAQVFTFVWKSLGLTCIDLHWQLATIVGEEIEDYFFVVSLASFFICPRRGLGASRRLD